MEESKDSLIKFKKLFNDDAQEATYIDIQKSLMFLSRVLNTHFGKTVIILMDEYDAPINHALQN